MFRFHSAAFCAACAVGLAALTGGDASAQGCYRAIYHPPAYIYYSGAYYPWYVQVVPSSVPGGPVSNGTVRPSPAASTGTRSFYPLPAETTTRTRATSQRRTPAVSVDRPPRAWQPGDPNPGFTHTNE